MNAKQREFLVKKIEQTYKTEYDALENSIPEEPNVNNYLMSSILTGTINIKEPKEISKLLKSYVQKNNVKEVASKSNYSSYFSRARKRGKDEDEFFYLDVPFNIFINFSDEYAIAYKEYEKKKKDIEKQKDLLTAKKDNLLLKINLGSDATLVKLIAQVDSTGDLDINMLSMNINRLQTNEAARLK